MMVENFWRLVWESQGGRCKKCAMPTKLEDSGTESRSFDVICKDCFSNPEPHFVIIDDVAEVYDEDYARDRLEPWFEKDLT